ncbi:MAG: hypothetical protein PGN13_16360 [Patulibacter minatonensis]
MALEASKLVIPFTGELFIAPAGTTMPADHAAVLPAAWVGCGYTTEDGPTFGVDTSVVGIRAWQSRSEIRRVLESIDHSVSMQLLQWSAHNLRLAFGGGTVSTISAGKFKFVFPKDTDALPEFAAILQFQDGSKVYRLCYQRVTPADGGETTLSSTEPGSLDLSLAAMTPTDGETAYLLTNDPAFSTGS